MRRSCALDVSVVMVLVWEAGGATVLLPAHGPGVVLKRKGTKSQGRVHLHTQLYLILLLRPCSLSHWPDVLCPLPVGYQKNILLRDLVVTRRLLQMFTVQTSSHTVRSSAGHPNHHTQTPYLVSTGVNRLTCIALYLSELQYHARLYVRMAAAVASRTP